METIGDGSGRTKYTGVEKAETKINSFSQMVAAITASDMSSIH